MFKTEYANSFNLIINPTTQETVLEIFNETPIIDRNTNSASETENIKVARVVMTEYALKELSNIINRSFKNNQQK